MVTSRGLKRVMSMKLKKTDSRNKTESTTVHDKKTPGTAQKKSRMTATPSSFTTRNCCLWLKAPNMHQAFLIKEIKRQEAIFQLIKGEQKLIEDLQLVRKVYHDPMLKLSIMTEEDLAHIFGNLDAYIPLHKDFLVQLEKAIRLDGTVGEIGQIVVSWLPNLSGYCDYCSQQLAAKALLDQKKQNPRVKDFLQRCLVSPFSRKLDLWSFLDVPRSRLVKYPLLLKDILRYTPPEHPDTAHLERAISLVQSVISDIDLKIGETECRYYMEKLEYLDERHRDLRLEHCRTLLCHGELRSKGGTKLYAFLFTNLLVLTRPMKRGQYQRFQVHQPPIPVRDLVLEDIPDGGLCVRRFLMSAFGHTVNAKNVFRIRCRDSSPGRAHTLQVKSVFHKQQWIKCLRSAITLHQEVLGDV